jgi:hypothetical protein
LLLLRSSGRLRKTRPRVHVQTGFFSLSCFYFLATSKNAVNNNNNKKANPSLFDDDYPPVDFFLLSQKAADLLYSNRDIDVTLETSTLFCASNQLWRQLVNYLFYFACQRGRKVRHSK